MFVDTKVSHHLTDITREQVCIYFDSFMVSQFKVILVYINIVATALARKVFQP